MAVNVSAPLLPQATPGATELTFHPRLRPRSTQVHAFEEALSESLAGSAGGAEAGKPAASKSVSSRFPEVRGPILMNSQADSRTGAREVRGRITLPAEETPTAPAAPEQTAQAATLPAPSASSEPQATPSQFTPEEQSLLHAAARVSAPARRSSSAKRPSLGAPPAAVAADPGQPGDLDSLIRTASAQLGKRYSFGGGNPRQGFDCSGLSSYVYSRNGLDLPRSSREQYSQGAPVERDDLRKGDLVFFGRKGVSHVGIYMDDGKFIHAASSGGAVKVGDLDDPLWNKLYAGARRVL
ncbi:MAG: C40 family peptidase [Acidobacteriota bacterium]